MSATDQEFICGNPICKRTLFKREDENEPWPLRCQNCFWLNVPDDQRETFREHPKYQIPTLATVMIKSGSCLVAYSTPKPPGTVMERTATESSLVRADDETEQQPLSELPNKTTVGDRKRKTSKRRKRAQSNSADDPNTLLSDRLAAMRRDTQARDLAMSLLKDGKPAANVCEALVSNGMQSEEAKALMDELLDVLPNGWKVAIYASLFVPCVGPWFIVLGSSIMYYYWRGTYPRKAAEINKHGWIAWLLGNVLFVVLLLFFRR